MPADRESSGGEGLPRPDPRAHNPVGRQSKVARVLGMLRRLSPWGNREAQAPPAAVPPQPKPRRLRSAEGDSRRMMALVAACAREHKPVQIKYRKATAGDQVIYRTISPYGLRYKSTAVRGRSGYLYAACAEHGNETHSFLVSHLDGVWETEEPWGGQYAVEF